MNAFDVDLGLSVLCAIRQPRETFTLQQIADACGTSRERIRQIQCAALDKLARDKTSRDLYAETFNKRPIIIESYLQRCNRLNRARTAQRQRFTANSLW